MEIQCNLYIKENKLGTHTLSVSLSLPPFVASITIYHEGREVLTLAGGKANQGATCEPDPRVLWSRTPPSVPHIEPHSPSTITRYFLPLTCLRPA